jgi:hypothetical protein
MYFNTGSVPVQDIPVADYFLYNYLLTVEEKPATGSALNRYE